MYACIYIYTYLYSCNSYIEICRPIDSHTQSTLKIPSAKASRAEETGSATQLFHLSRGGHGKNMVGFHWGYPIAGEFHGKSGDIQ